MAINSSLISTSADTVVVSPTPMNSSSSVSPDSPPSDTMMMLMNITSISSIKSDFDGIESELLDKSWIFSLVILILYLTLTLIQAYAFVRQRTRNVLVYLFTISLEMYTLALFLSTLDAILFRSDNDEPNLMPLIVDILRISALALFILFVLIIAKGWPITRSEVSAKPLVAMAWFAYLASEILLYSWTKGTLSQVSEDDIYLTVPGWISLGLRIIIMMWFLFELRATMMLEQDQQKLRFYLHFGVGIMVWFVYLPIIVFIGSQTSIEWKYNFIFVFSLLVNFLAYAIMAHFLWPTKLTYHFLTHPTESDYSEGMDECEETSRDSFNCLSHINYGNVSIM
ncbi:uncharacterized protein LOC128391380 isoform X2 [Panonychus citri]|uniref:uncharacterized protein LOC128391380 isoform X2 n=1 Tax=Panonychus citri TaxID=50023 RepID=UPI0023075B8D|nr:uncharacterized protein LOC128391380 isoform X2 [Panonychus citri]